MAAYQHLSMAVLRAVENHVCLARVARAGFPPSLMVPAASCGPWKLQRPQVQIALELAWLPGGSLYTGIGDVFAWVCVIIAGLALL